MRARGRLSGHARRVRPPRESFLVYVLGPNATDRAGDVPGSTSQAAGDSPAEPQPQLDTGTASTLDLRSVSSGTSSVHEQTDTGTSSPSTATKAVTIAAAKSTTAVPRNPASRVLSETTTSLTPAPSKTARLFTASAPAADVIASQSQSTTPRPAPIPSSSTTTASSAAPTEGSATGTTQTSSFDSAQPSATKPPAHEGLGLYAGITFGAILGVGVVVALMAYWLRVRHRIRRQAISRTTTWPWDHDRLGARQDTLERGTGGPSARGRGSLSARGSRRRGGGGGGGGLRTWDPARMVEASTSGAGQTKARFAIEDDCPPAPLPKAGPSMKMREGHATSLAPAAAAAAAADADRPARTIGSPFVAVPLHAVRGREQSVPDMMQEMGTLKITNLMPGDITSGGESSRASTALGFSDGPGSPDSESESESDDGRALTTPRAVSTLAAEDGTTPTPTPAARLLWAPLRTWKTKGAWQEGHKLEDGDDVALPFPGNSPAPSEPDVEAEAKRDGWAVSIRSNLVSALNAVVGGGASQAKGTDTGDDNLTRPPERRPSERRRGDRGRRASTGDMEHCSDIASPVHSPKRWSLVEIESGRGLVRFHGHPEQGSGLTDNLFPVDSQASAEDQAVHKQEGENLETFDNDRTPGPSNRPPTRSDTTETKLRRPHPSLLATIPSVSRSSHEEEPEMGLVRKKTADQHRRRTKRRRPVIVTRKSSSQSSAVSVGSDMSRMSSVPSEGLTNAERYAKNVLRERRRRVMEMAVGRGRPSRSRATTISRRRPKEKEKLKQRLEKEAE